MSNSGTEFTVDDKLLLKKFHKLDEMQREKFHKYVVLKSLQIVENQTIKNLQASLSRPSLINKVDKYNQTLKDGIWIKLEPKRRKGTISIMGNYKLKWLEKGTNVRYIKSYNGINLKKKRNVGYIKASFFFKKALKETEKQVFGEMEKLMKDKIRKL